jgi:hypothetical protein
MLLPGVKCKVNNHLITSETRQDWPLLITHAKQTFNPDNWCYDNSLGCDTDFSHCGAIFFSQSQQHTIPTTELLSIKWVDRRISVTDE